MQPLCYIAVILLCSVQFLYSECSILCNKTQYPWPMDPAQYCCNKCKPGHLMRRRSENSCNIECILCTGNRYSDSYNVGLSCNLCRNCQKPNMDYKSLCNATHNAVCRCRAGYRCKDQTCTQCGQIPTTTKPTLPPNNTTMTSEALTPLWVHPKPNRDTVWFLVITALLCIGIAIVVVTQLKPFLCWRRFKHGYFLTEKSTPEPQYAEDDEVSKPVQEVCGQCDQPIDV